jgi:hypothetical protein
MKSGLQLMQNDNAAVEIHRRGGGLLLRYVFRPETSPDEAPRPYVHPVCTLAGELLTNFRPNDHRWHHALSFTIANVEGHNFWGGPTYRETDGYRWRGDHGLQRHRTWLALRPDHLAHTIDWQGATDELLLQEERSLQVDVLSTTVWTLRWRAELRNVSGRTLALSHYQSGQGLAGSHYTGLQFRGARDLLDDHGDAGIGIVAATGIAGEPVHGALAEWMEWRGQKDGTQRRVTVRFANNSGPLHWFVRRNNPLAAFPFHYERDLLLENERSLSIDHTLTFTDS